MPEPCSCCLSRPRRPDGMLCDDCYLWIHLDDAQHGALAFLVLIAAVATLCLLAAAR